jgi:hypothetical protein
MFFDPKKIKIFKGILKIQLEKKKKEKLQEYIPVNI